MIHKPSEKLTALPPALLRRTLFLQTPLSCAPDSDQSRKTATFLETMCLVVLLWQHKQWQPVSGLTDSENTMVDVCPVYCVVCQGKTAIWRNGKSTLCPWGYFIYSQWVKFLWITPLMSWGLLTSKGRATWESLSQWTINWELYDCMVGCTVAEGLEVLPHVTCKKVVGSMPEPAASTFLCGILWAPPTAQRHGDLVIIPPREWTWVLSFVNHS